MNYRQFLTNLVIVTLVAAVYFGAAKLGLALAFVNASASAVWPPTGVAIAALLLLGPRAWPGVFIGAFIANLTTTGTVATSLTIAAGNTLEGAAGAWLVQRYANGLDAFTHTATVFRFVLLAGLLAPIISATIGVSSLGLGGLMPWGTFGAVWQTWWLGDVVGAVVVAPFIVLWGRWQDWRALIPRAVPPGGRQWLEAALLLLTLLVVGRIVFGAANNAPLEFTCIPVLIWAAFRFGPRAAATVALLLSAIAIWGTLHGQGPFYRGTPNESLLVLQMFIGVTVAMSLILAAAVAERARAEQALRESEQRFRATFDQAAVGIAHIAPAGSWLQVNQRLCEIVGYMREELLQRTSQDITHPDDLDIDLAYVGQMLANEISSYSIEKRYIRKDGSLVWINLTVSLVRRASGAPKYFISVVEDITVRKRADAALRESEERFAKAFRASPVAMIITRVSDNCFIDVNERFCHMLDYSPEEVLGRSSLDLNLLADPQDRATRVRIQRERGSVRDYETIVRSRSGELHAVLLSVEAIELAGEPCFLTILVDISDRKRAEQALVRTADRLRHLREIDLSILAVRPLAEIAQAAVSHLWELLACTRVSVIQADIAARTITLFATQAKGELRVPAGLQAPLEILGEALEPLMRGQIYQVPDLAELSELPPALRAAQVEHVRGYCYIPIIADAELIGILGLGSDEPGLFSAGQLDIAHEAADQLSIAMRQARLQDQIQRYAAQLEQRVAERTAELQVALGRMEALYSITRTAIASEHWPAAMQQMVDCVATAIPANRASLIIFDQLDRRVPHLICGGVGGEHIVATVSFDELLDGLTGWVMREGRSARSPKGAPDPRESAAVQRRRADTNCGAIAVVPLRYQDQVLGTITVINLPEERDFSEADIDLLEAIAGQVAVAHVRASLYERLEHATARLGGILDIADDAIIAVNRHQEIELFNQGAERIFGYAADEVRGQPLDMLLPAHVVATHHQHFDTFTSVAPVARRMGERRDIFGKRRDGTEFPAEASISKLNINDEPVFTVILRDITARKRAEDELKTFATKLEHRNRELQEFTSVASHDLQEPLRKIQAFGDLLKTEYSAALDVEGRDYLERMQNAAGRMQTLINDLLTLARLGSEARLFVPVDLNQVAREVLDDLEARIVGTGGRVDLGDLPTIEADPLQMRQLLQNVIGNALKFCRPGEPPIVKIRNHLIAGAEPRLAASAPSDSCCRISVEDNGIGFDERYLDRIFAVFQRLHGRSEYEGAGIGLSVCRRIAERHGGSITATSRPGQGTTFIITLPVNQASGRNSS
jgi:two-component system sensor kinase FixL